MVGFSMKDIPKRRRRLDLDGNNHEIFWGLLARRVPSIKSLSVSFFYSLAGLGGCSALLFAKSRVAQVLGLAGGIVLSLIIVLVVAEIYIRAYHDYRRLRNHFIHM